MTRARRAGDRQGVGPLFVSDRHRARRLDKPAARPRTILCARSPCARFCHGHGAFGAVLLEFQAQLMRFSFGHSGVRAFRSPTTTMTTPITIRDRQLGIHRKPKMLSFSFEVGVVRPRGDRREVLLAGTPRRREQTHRASSRRRSTADQHVPLVDAAGTSQVDSGHGDPSSARSMPSRTLSPR